MPRHLICDAHEWINEISTVPTYGLANQQPRERAWVCWRFYWLPAGKEDPVEFDSSLYMWSDLRGVVVGGSYLPFGVSDVHERPLLLMSLYLRNYITKVIVFRCWMLLPILVTSSSRGMSYSSDIYRWGVWLGRHICYKTTQVNEGKLRKVRNLS